MDKYKQRNLAKVLAVCAFILGLGCILMESEGIYHYWIDESPGPDYVEYDRTLLEATGIWMTWLMVNCAIGAFIYFVISPTS